MLDLHQWQARFATWIEQELGQADVSHDPEHIRRVVRNAQLIQAETGGDLAIIIPAAWLHDCVVVSKASPLRSQASRMAAEHATQWLASQGYPKQYLPAISHAIAAHSFSANIQPETLEAQIVQDADRLDSLGAIGLARCLMLSVELGRRLYDPQQPIPRTRPADDQINSIDHFYTKLLKLPQTMQTATGRALAEQRTGILNQFLDQLAQEVGES